MSEALKNYFEKFGGIRGFCEYMGIDSLDLDFKSLELVAESYWSGYWQSFNADTKRLLMKH